MFLSYFQEDVDVGLGVLSVPLMPEEDVTAGLGLDPTALDAVDEPEAHHGGGLGRGCHGKDGERLVLTPEAALQVEAVERTCSRASTLMRSLARSGCLNLLMTVMRRAFVSAGLATFYTKMGTGLAGTRARPGTGGASSLRRPRWG